MKELKFEALSVEQKIGMVTCALFDPWDRRPEADEYVYEKIRNHALGCVWVYSMIPDFEEVMAKLRETADYPLLIITDAGSGLPPYEIGRHNALGMVDSEDLAYTFGKVTAINAHNKGFNIVCNPILDMCKGASVVGQNTGSIGSDKHRVAKLAAAVARGMHDGGVLTVGKHYPSAHCDVPIDGHMAEMISTATKEELLENNLYPYRELMKEDLLDGIMTTHVRIPSIDPDYPASLSKKVNAVIRDLGYKGFAVSDALSMMGIVAKFGETDSKGLAVENGNDIALVWCPDYRDGYDAVYNCYKKGILTDERLDEATKRVLDAQHKVFRMQPKYTQITQEDIVAINRINTDSVYGKADDGLDVSVSRDGRHLFIVLAENETDIKDGKLSVDTFSGGWYDPARIIKRINELFPNSETVALREFPTIVEIARALHKATEYDDVVLVIKMEGRAYAGRDEYTPRIISMAEAMQVSGQVAAVVHFGSPFALEAMPHFPRLIIGANARDCVMASLEVLAGNYPAKGKLTYSVNLK